MLHCAASKRLETIIELVPSLTQRTGSATEFERTPSLLLKPRSFSTAVLFSGSVRTRSLSVSIGDYLLLLHLLLLLLLLVAGFSSFPRCSTAATSTISTTISVVATTLGRGFQPPRPAVPPAALSGREPRYSGTVVEVATELQCSCGEQLTRNCW